MFWIALSAALTAVDLISKKIFTKRKDLKWILIRPTKIYGLIYNQLDDRPLVPKILTGCITGRCTAVLGTAACRTAIRCVAASCCTASCHAIRCSPV